MQVFFCEIFKIFKITLFKEYLWRLAASLSPKQIKRSKKIDIGYTSIFVET